MELRNPRPSLELGSAIPTGWGSILFAGPGVETPGYCRVVPAGLGSIFFGGLRRD